MSLPVLSPPPRLIAFWCSRCGEHIVEAQVIGWSPLAWSACTQEGEGRSQTKEWVLRLAPSRAMPKVARTARTRRGQ